MADETEDYILPASNRSWAALISVIRSPIQSEIARMGVDTSFPSGVALDCLAKHFLGSAIGIDIGGIEQVDACLQAYVHQATGLLCIGGAPIAEERAAECACAKTEDRNLEAGFSE
ncbi:hypothetical protein VE25_05375 [Devosia geojensis]|uniref:Uncharacterized protein n=1 Tax=Devosia geojensis TaxID=443610 RepID=A0A0F5FVC2_9HYPH|nr:hypothetical protein VE25_05375 [Devosia geojensis]